MDIKLVKPFVSGGRKYCIDQFGAVHQTDARPFVYDEAYVATYSSPAYQAGARALSCLRLGWALGCFQARYGHSPASLLDVGYGIGAFMVEACKMIPVVHGKEVAPSPVPPGCERVDRFDAIGYDLITFWDSLEHHAELGFLATLRARMLLISLPWCHRARGAWFETWKHRKPDEHLHHFSNAALYGFLASVGWQVIAGSHHEDIVRVPSDGRENILSVACIRK